MTEKITENYGFYGILKWRAFSSSIPFPLSSPSLLPHPSPSLLYPPLQLLPPILPIPFLPSP